MTTKAILSVLVRAWTYTLLRKQDPKVWARVSADSLEGDGRKQPKALKALEAEGFIHQGEKGWLATSRAYDEMIAVKPDVCALLNTARDEWAVKQVHGAFLDHLTHEERKYIVEHMSEYTLLESVGMGDARPFDFTSDVVLFGRGDLIVSDDSFVQAKATRLREIRFERAYKANLAWGLTELGIIQEVDADVFKAAGDGPLGLGPPSVVFGDDPVKWGEQATRGVERMREQIAKATRYANVLASAEVKIAAFGGWPVVLEAYKAKLVQALEEQERKKAVNE